MQRHYRFLNLSYIVMRSLTLPFSPDFKFCILAFEYPEERTRLPAYGDVERLVILGIIRISNRSRFVFSWVVLFNLSDKKIW